MKFNLQAASFLALALFTLPLAAQQAQPAAPKTIEQVVPEEVLALLADTRPANELTLAELQKRAKMAKLFAQVKALPTDLHDQLKNIAEVSQAELETRKQADDQRTGSDKAAQQQAAADKAAMEQAAAEKLIADKAAKEQAAAAAKAKGEQAAKDQASTQNDQQALASKLAEVDAVVPAPKLPVADVAPVGPVGKAAPSSAPAVPAGEASPPKLVLEAPPVLKVVPPPPAPPPESKPLPQVAIATPAPEVIVAPSAADAKALESNFVDPTSEKQAQAYLADKRELTSLNDDELRKRLDVIRELMAANELAHDTERAVREKLKIEREVLRQRVAQAEATQQIKKAQAAASNAPPVAPDVSPKSLQTSAAAVGNTTNIINTTNTTNIITVLTPPQQVLRDRRPAENLDVSELQIRIQIFSDAQTNNTYDQSYRDYWRASVERDRAILRRRLIEERRRREAEMAMRESDNSFYISNEYVPSERRRRDVFAAEIDSQEMIDVLVAPPQRVSENQYQRYKVDQIATQPKLRNSISRIEIDTIRFGTNEAFIRDEQVRNLDAIAAIIEKIVKKYPNEVFLIEGHTDAPGSALYNARLSKLRAESIKRALVSYYVIPAKNLRTVGLGKRFLKIPTAEAEPENRRVSIARITPLLVQR